MKQKYLHSKVQNNDDLSDMDLDSIKQSIEDEYKLQIDQKMYERDSVLQELKSSVFNESNKPKENNFKKSHEEFLSNKISHKEYLNRARKLMLQISNKQAPDFKIDQNYGNYSSLDKTFTFKSDQTEKWKDLDEHGYTGKKIMQFIKTLGPEYNIYNNQQEQMKQVKNQNPRLNEEELQNKMFEEEDNSIKWLKNGQVIIDDDENGDQMPETIQGLVHLSNNAKEDLYRLYLDGWSVKDLSHRYGILPQRVKAIVWLKHKFYFEILPNMDLSTIYLGLQTVINWSKYMKFVDFGVDLDDLNRINKGVITPSFTKYRDVDVLTKHNLDERAQQLMSKKMRKKRPDYQIDSEMYGKGAKAYILKEDVVLNGRGRNRVSYMFKKSLKYSHDPTRLPNKVSYKLAQGLGPRKATHGYNNYGYAQ